MTKSVTLDYTSSFEMKEIGALVEQRPGHVENLVRVQNVLGLVNWAAKPLKMVGATGIEPVTPTMST